MNIEDKILLREIQNRNKAVFEAVFHDYYSGLIRFAEGIVFDEKVCEDIVQNIFLHVWEKAEFLTIDSSLKSYLYKAVKNRCLNYIRNLKIRDKHNLLYLEACLNDSNVDFGDSEILSQIEATIQALPPKMAEIFRLKYLSEKSIRDIAQELEVSENTVKTQLLRAKGKLRISLQESLNLNFLL
ncbi:DNA-directed RNA polymerase sigma-70 factor [Echinicola pacifica]|uniref:DNA-directed RNA polymerase sigma-70 factor n=1 Tax=Echinicola pacifica TaxID=346377 RepID=A0A918Q9V0_9BACT|nr:RNA polymerase sigma-70 factor [Echinicola pacifica]GGZ37551.1 DNA-directed RNA polymerase sigma-70 factor [Echinicola pacifica]